MSPLEAMRNLIPYGMKSDVKTEVLMQKFQNVCKMKTAML